MNRPLLMLACLLAIPLSVLVACGPAPMSSESGGNDGRQVELMAEAPDGTRLWRFYTGGRYVYFASTGAQWARSCGKNCTRVENVPTAADTGHGHAPDSLAPDSLAPDPLSGAVQ